MISARPSVSLLAVLLILMFQHQQQVVTAVERAKQVTMAELNSIIGVSILKSWNEIIASWRHSANHRNPNKYFKIQFL